MTTLAAAQSEMANTQPTRISRYLPLAAGIATAALVIVIGSLLFRDSAPATQPLPSPQAMLANGFGKAPADELVGYWESRAATAPDDVIVLTRLGQAQMTFASEVGDLAYYELAETSFRAALQHNPSSDGALLGLAGAVSAQHGFVEAQTILDTDSFSPSLNETVLTSRGDAALELGDVQLAGALYSQVVALTPGEPAINSRLARLAYLQGDTDRAVELATGALRSVGTLDLRAADAAFYWFQLANYQWRSGDTSSALTNLDNALSIFPDHLGSLELYGRVLVSEARYEEAISAFEALVMGGGAADLHGELEKLYTATGQFDAAAEQNELGRAAASEQIDLFVAERRHLVDFYSSHDPAVALELARLDFADRQDIYSHDALAWALHLNGFSEEAAAHADAGLALGTREAKLHYHAGMIALSNGDTALARLRLTTALEIDENFDVAHAPVAKAALERVD